MASRQGVVCHSLQSHVANHWLEEYMNDIAAAAAAAAAGKEQRMIILEGEKKRDE